jgi:hypothetical protein
MKLKTLPRFRQDVLSSVVVNLVWHSTISLIFLILVPDIAEAIPELSECTVRILDPENGTVFFIENRERTHLEPAVTDFRVVYSWDCDGCVQALCELNGLDFKGEETCGIGFTNTLVLDSVPSRMVIDGENVLALHLDVLENDGTRTHMASAWSEFTVRILRPATHDLVPPDPPSVSTRMGLLKTDPASYLHSVASWITPLQPQHVISNLLFEVPFHDDIAIDVIAKVRAALLASMSV